MRRTWWMALTVGAMATGADAQLAGLFGKSLGLPPKGEAGGAYRSGDRVRTYVTGDPYDQAALQRKLIEKASAMAGAKGFARIGVTGARCTSAVINGTPRSTSCSADAVMLRDAAAVIAGDGRVQYYTVSDVARGIVAPLAG